MGINELLFLLFIDLQSIYRKNISIDKLTFPQLIALYIIPFNGIEMSLLSKKIGVDISTLSRLINGLERKKLVNRIPDKKDKRIIRICLSSNSDVIKDRLEKQIDKIGDVIESKIKPSQKDNFNNVLSKLHWEIAKVLLNNDVV